MRQNERLEPDGGPPSGELAPVIVLGGPEKLWDSGGAASIGFELEVFGKTEDFLVSVASKEAKLSDIVPLARKLSTRLAISVLENLGERGESVPCRKGCSNCCRYLIPLSVPEVFRFRDEILCTPEEPRMEVLWHCLQTADGILEAGFVDCEAQDQGPGDDQSDVERIGRWYAGLGLGCPLLSRGLCTWYDQRPTVCREHIVVGTAIACQAEYVDESHVAPMPVSVLQVLGQFTAELEESAVEAVMLPLALPWAQENIERGERTWPAAFMVERFIEILKATAAQNREAVDAATESLGKVNAIA